MGIKHAAAFLVLFLAFQNSQALGQVVATWTDATGNWSNAANWSTNTVPNNGGGTTYSVVIGTTTSNSVVTMDILNDTIDNLNLTGDGNSLTISSGNSLTLTPGAGSSSDNGGTINNYGAFHISPTGPAFAMYELGSAINNYGFLENAQTSTLINDGFTTNNGTLINAGNISTDEGPGGGGTINNNTLINNGTLSEVSTGISNSGTLVNSPGARIDLEVLGDGVGGGAFSAAAS